MAGVTDRPFRMLCRSQGAALAVSEMTIADLSLRDTDKSRLRRDHAGEPAPIAVQIAGYDPAMMAEAARFNVDHGAQIIDINLGCPAKKVCRVDAGSALMRDPDLVARICEATVAAVSVPVTLKMRTGWSAAHRNAVDIARRAEAAGIAALVVHGRTRDQRYEGWAEHGTLAEVVRAVRIPVLANGDIVDAQSARRVMQESGCAGVMIGRAALGRPWLFRSLSASLRGEALPGEPGWPERAALLLDHLDALHAFYGPGRGVRVARKHIHWAIESEPAALAAWPQLATIGDVGLQRRAVAELFDRLCDRAVA